MNQNQNRLIVSAETPWASTGIAGVERKLLADAVGVGEHEVAMIRLAAGAQWSLPEAGIEVFVLHGDCSLATDSHTAGGYLRLPAARDSAVATTTTGCTLFVRIGAWPDTERAALQLREDERVWHPGQGNLRVQPLHSHGDEGTALVHWPAGERFVPHRHWGGEEILVLSGEFVDEHGRYPTGTWLLSPHLSSHHPFVDEQTVIFVKTGHLLPVDAT